MFLILLASTLFIIFILLKYQTTKEPEKNTQKVAVTIFPLYDIVRNIAGEEIETVLIVDPGASPHTFDPTPDDLKRIQNAQAVFMIGYGIDNWAGKLATSLDIPKQITTDANVTLREFTEDDEHDDSEEENHIEGSIDPHYWLSIPNTIGIAAQVRDELSILYPEHKAIFEQNYNIYKNELETLDQEIRSEIDALPNKNIATFHNAWGYFADEYGISIVATFEEFPGEEPSAEYLREFTKKISEHQVTVIFAEPQFSTSSLEPIADDLGIRISQLAPEGKSDITSYTELMRYNVHQITSAQK